MKNDEHRVYFEFNQQSSLPSSLANKTEQTFVEIISYKRKPLVPSNNHQFYDTSTSKNWTTIGYSADPLRDIVQDKNCYEFGFERRSDQYCETLKNNKNTYI